MSAAGFMNRSGNGWAGGSRISKSLRITNRERILLALEDAHLHSDGYEVPRRFAQAGLAVRLGMAQSHVSRAIGALIQDRLVAAERRRVTGERRRVMAYTLTERGQDWTADLVRQCHEALVLSKAEDGALTRLTFDELVSRWERSGWRRPADHLGLADLLREAPQHDGLPLLEQPPELGLPEVVDLSAEAIGLHLELATLRHSQGDLEEAASHMARASDLHRQRGNAEGEVRTGVLAIEWGADLSIGGHWASTAAKISDAETRLHTEVGVHIATLLSGNLPSQVSTDERAVGRYLSVLGDGRMKDEFRIGILSQLWASNLTLPAAGHVGFRLYQLNRDGAILDRLESMFQSTGDARGLAVCVSLR